MLLGCDVLDSDSLLTPCFARRFCGQLIPALILTVGLLVLCFLRYSKPSIRLDDSTDSSFCDTVQDAERRVINSSAAEEAAESVRLLQYDTNAVFVSTHPWREWSEFALAAILCGLYVGQAIQLRAADSAITVVLFVSIKLRISE